MLDIIAYYTQFIGEIISSLIIVGFLGFLPFIFYLMLVKKVIAYEFF